MKWSVCGWATHAGQPGAVFGCNADHGGGAESRTSTISGRDNGGALTVDHIVPRWWGLKNMMAAAISIGEQFCSAKLNENWPNKHKHEYSQKMFDNPIAVATRRGTFQGSSFPIKGSG